MAHLEKYPKAGLWHLLKHNERTEQDRHVNRSNQNIVPERTRLNYNLAPQTRLSMHDVLMKRLSEVRLYRKCYGRLGHNEAERCQRRGYGKIFQGGL